MNQLLSILLSLTITVSYLETNAQADNVRYALDRTPIKLISYSICSDFKSGKYNSKTTYKYDSLDNVIESQIFNKKGKKLQLETIITYEYASSKLKYVRKTKKDSIKPYSTKVFEYSLDNTAKSMCEYHGIYSICKLNLKGDTSIVKNYENGILKSQSFFFKDTILKTEQYLSEKDTISYNFYYKLFNDSIAYYVIDKFKDTNIYKSTVYTKNQVKLYFYEENKLFEKIVETYDSSGKLVESLDINYLPNGNKYRSRFKYEEVNGYYHVTEEMVQLR